MYLLAGDIGGTSTRLLLAQAGAGKASIIKESVYRSADYPELLPVIKQFLSESTNEQAIQAACFAVAGPVHDNTCNVTNLPWHLDADTLKQQLGISHVSLVNDFMAVAMGVEVLADEDVQVLQPGKLAKKTFPDAAIIGAGTGLGAAHRVYRDNGYHILTSEVGHAGFAPANELQCELLNWLQKKRHSVSQELLLSGRGIANLYDFLSTRYPELESSQLKQAMRAGDPAQVITDYAFQHQDNLCNQVLDLFVDIYASVASNLVMYYYPVDELYIAGGIAPKLRQRLASPRFLQAFQARGLMSDNMKNIHIKLVLQDKVGLLGALSCIAAGAS